MNVQFQACVRHAQINNNGDLLVTLEVPFAQKYAAMPVTDAPGMLLLISATSI